MFDLESQKIFYAYSTGNQKLFEKLTSKPSLFQRVVMQLAGSKHSESSKIREIIVAKTLGFTPNLTTNGHDCYDPKGNGWEIKTEQRNKKLDGIGVFHYSHKDNLDKYLDQKVLQSGFNDGKLVYIVSYRFDETDIYQRLLGSKDTNIVAYAASQWQLLPSLKLHYLNPKYHNFQYMSATLYDILEDLDCEL